MNKHVDHGLVAERTVAKTAGESARPLRVSPASGPVLSLAPEVLDAHPLNRPIILNGITPTFRPGRFANNLHDALGGNCVGYGFAINRGGERVRSGGGGARQLAQDPDDNLSMSSGRKMHTASVSKTLTATALLKALRDQGRDTTALIRDFLPSQWSMHPNLIGLTMADLLTHRTGFNTFASDPGYTSLKPMMENATGWSPTIAANPYDNRHYGLIRLILPYLVCPQVMANVEAEGWGNGTYDPSVDQATQSYYKLLMRHYVFDPMGMQNMDCVPDQSNPDRTMCYMWPNPALAQEQDGGDKSAEAGGEGWVMSARQLAKFLRFRRYSDAFLHPDLRDAMDAEGFGWGGTSGDYGTYLSHGGAYGAFSASANSGNGGCVPGSGPLRTCIMQFHINVEAAVVVNSFVRDCQGPGTNLSRIVADAFDAAFV